MNEFFSYLEDITASPGYLKGWRIFRMTAVALGPKHLSSIRIEGKNHKRCGLLITSRSDRLTEVCFSPR